ncbi:unnamed protein product [Effrenium voratum]|nr:unnamed protein product [Effrenium voratum]
MADELVEAAQKGNVEKLKAFFKKGISADSTRAMHACVMAARERQEDAVRVFLENGVPLTCSDREGKRLLHTCARNDCAETIKLMVSMRADVTKPDSDGAMAISLAIKNKFRGAVKELLMGGASVPTNAEMPGLAAVVMEAQLEQCANEIRPLADTEVDPAELVEAEKVVLEGMKEHQRLIKLSEDSRASKVLVDLEARIVEAQAKVEETQQGTAELLDELSQRKIDVRNAEQELSKLRKETSAVLETLNQTKEEDSKLTIDLEESHKLLKEAGSCHALLCARVQADGLVGGWCPG